MRGGAQIEDRMEGLMGINRPVCLIKVGSGAKLER